MDDILPIIGFLRNELQVVSSKLQDTEGALKGALSNQ